MNQLQILTTLAMLHRSVEQEASSCPRLHAWAAQRQGNVAAAASRRQHCVRFDRPGNRTPDLRRRPGCLQTLRQLAGINQVRFFIPISYVALLNFYEFQYIFLYATTYK